MHPSDAGSAHDKTAGGTGERDPRRCEADLAGSEGATRAGLAGSEESPETEANSRGSGRGRGGRAREAESPETEAKILPP